MQSTHENSAVSLLSKILDFPNVKTELLLSQSLSVLKNRTSLIVKMFILIYDVLGFLNKQMPDAVNIDGYKDIRHIS